MSHTSNTQLIQKALKLHTNGQIGAATQLYQQVLASDPDNFDALHLFGAAALETGEFETAVERIQQALQHGTLEGSAAQRSKRLGDAHNNLAIAQQKLRQFDAALASTQKAVHYQPDNADLLTNRGCIYKMLGQYAPAETDLRRALQINPNHVKALVALAIVLYVTDRFQEAETFIDRAMQLRPNDAPTQCTKGILCVVNNRPEQALQHYDEALRCDPNYEDAWHNRAILRLALRRFGAAWPDRYLHDPNRRNQKNKRPLPQDLTSKRVCVRRNQGIGDELFFMRFIPALKARGAHVTYQTETRMLSFAARIAGIDAVLNPDDMLTNMNHVVAVDYLPYYLEQGDTDIPASIHLTASPNAIQQAAIALAQAGTPPYLGVTWRAGRIHTEVDFRQEAMEILYKDAPIEQLAETIRDWPGTILMLQRNPSADEMARFQQALQRPAIDFTTANNDLEYMLALLSLIERYVAVSNTNLHLRAAVGLPTHVLVPWPPEWRWGLRTDRSPWFPNCPVYRQTPDRDWQPALTRLREELLL